MGYVQQAYADQYRREHTALGSHPDTGDVLHVTDIDRRSGMYVPGKAGMGKSSFLETIAIQDIKKGNALVFVDPHGDSVKNIIAQTPQAYMSRIFVLDLEDEDWPFGVNLFADALFETGMDKSKAIARVTNIFNVLWPETKNQANLPIHLNAAIVALLSNPGATLVDMLRLFRDPEFRHQMLQNVTDQDVLDQWREYEEGGKAVQNEAAALVKRLKLLFMGRDLVKNIVGQRQTSIDFRRAIEQRQIILIKLPVNEATEDAKLIGTFLMSQLTFALFSFGDTDAAERPGVTIIIDECQNFTTPDFERLITQGRKYGARLVLAHQARGQLLDFLQEATIGCRTIVAFRTNIDDARELAPLFHTTQTEIKPEDISSNAVKELLHMGFELPHQVQVFVETYLRRLKSTGDIVAKGTESNLYEHITQGTHGRGITDRRILLPNPTSGLNNLFREVMVSSNPNLPIAPLAVEGLANSGLGFNVGTFFGKPDPRWLVADLSEFPPHLVGSTVHGWIWKRRPENKSEQLLHCIFHLRMTMQHLAEHPVGKASKSSSSDVAQLLSQLPPRHAFVQASDGVWYMRTLDTQPVVDAETLKARLFFIREQTRQTYCHPRSQVEGTPPAPADVDPDEPPTGRSRFEDA